MGGEKPPEPLEQHEDFKVGRGARVMAWSDRTLVAERMNSVECRVRRQTFTAGDDHRRAPAEMFTVLGCYLFRVP